MVNPVWYVRNSLRTQRVAAAADWHQACKAVRAVLGQSPSSVAAHAEARNVDAVEIDVVGLDDFVEQSRKDCDVPAVTEV